MLPRSWFSPKTEDSNAKQFTQSNDGPSNEDTADNVGSRPPLDRAITAALSTPHDAVLAELQGQRRGTDVHATVAALPEAPALPAIPSQGSLEVEVDPNTSVDAAAAKSTARDGAQSPTSTAGPSPETVYDPFTGNAAFVLPPVSHFEEAKDELWAQLSRIRELQSEIARQHLQMEVIGAGERRNPKKPPQRTHTDTIVVGEEWPDPAQEEQAREKARDAEFGNLAKAFEGRHAAIDGIMGKLDDLSKVLTTFHALPTPVMDFATSRNNTKDSMTTMFSSPSPTFTVPASPLASPPAPSQQASNNLHTAMEALEIPRADSPVEVLAVASAEA